MYLPKHSSWLNQIETIFGIIQRRVITRGSFTSVEDLKERLKAFIEYFNATFATPFNWTYTGRPITTPRDSRPKSWKENWVTNRKIKQAKPIMTP